MAGPSVKYRQMQPLKIAEVLGHKDSAFKLRGGKHELVVLLHQIGPFFHGDASWSTRPICSCDYG